LVAGVLPGLGTWVLGNGLVKTGADVGFGPAVGWAPGCVGFATGAAVGVVPVRAGTAGVGVRMIPGAANAGVGVVARAGWTLAGAGAARAGTPPGGVGVGGS
jgi:hypothetical protein